MFGLGTQELLVILVIVLVLFGANRLPELARSLGASMRELKKGIEEGKTGEGQTPSAPKDNPPEKVTVTCTNCKRALVAEWTHCPHCGTTVVRG
jgi:sec-independent protein translocase protein TatA